MFLIPPNETQLEFIKKEDIWKSKEKLEEDVTHLIEWLSKQPHLPNITDRSWLLHFITGCKYNLQRSKQVIEAYFIKRAEYSEFLEPFTEEQMLKQTRFGYILLFPKLTPEGNRIFCTINRCADDTTDFDVMMFSRISYTILDLQLTLEPMYGNIFLYDLKYITLSQFLAFTPTLTKKLLTLCIDAFPMRVKSIHFFNPPSFIGRLLTFFKMFLPNKIKERIFVHESIEDLHAYIPKDVLPDAYGGTNGTIEEYHQKMLQLHELYEDRFSNRPIADLSRLPGRNKNADELDMNGTFRQLQID